MGIRLVGAALNPHWASRLTPTARIVLITMCHTAKDLGSVDQPPGVYFAGHGFLILMVTGQEHRRGSPGYDAAKKQIQRSIRELIEAGAVNVVRHSGRNRNTHYEVTPDNYEGSSDEVPHPVSLL